MFNLADIDISGLTELKKYADKHKLVYKERKTPKGKFILDVFYELPEGITINSKENLWLQGFITEITGGIFDFTNYNTRKNSVGSIVEMKYQIEQIYGSTSLCDMYLEYIVNELSPIISNCGLDITLELEYGLALKVFYKEDFCLSIDFGDCGITVNTSAPQDWYETFTKETLAKALPGMFLDYFKYNKLNTIVIK